MSGFLSEHWLWIALGGALLAAEMLGAGGYLLWSGIAAILTGLLTWWLPAMSWQLQGLLFAILTVCAAYFWWRWQKRTPAAQPSLNQRSQHLIGMRATLSEPLYNGVGRVPIGDGSWRAQANEDLPAGCEVEVIAVEGTTLLIRAVRRNIH